MVNFTKNNNVAYYSLRSVLCFVICSCVYLAGCDSEVMELDPAVRNGDIYKRYEYPFTLSIGDKIGADIEIYKGTPAWKLAKAVYEQDTNKISELCKKHKELLSCKDPKYGLTLLHWAISYDRYFSAKKLAEMGADPNTRKHTGQTAFMSAAAKEGTPNYVKLLLKHGGNVNEKNELTDGGVYSILEIAADNNYESTKLLVEAGADVNFCPDGVNSPFATALVYGSAETAEYLIQKGADYRKPVISDAHSTLYAIDAIKNVLSSGFWKPGTAEYDKQIRLLQFLREHGCDSTIKD